MLPHRESQSSFESEGQDVATFFKPDITCKLTKLFQNTRKLEARKPATEELTKYGYTNAMTEETADYNFSIQTLTDTPLIRPHNSIFARDPKLLTSNIGSFRKSS